MSAPLVEVAGHRLEVSRIVGATPTLVLLHEGLGSVSMWRGFPAAVAAATGRAALVYSRWGYGGSEPRPAPWPLSFMHDEATRVLPALIEREGLGEVVLIGHSDGASIALLYASEPSSRAIRVVALAPHVMVEDVTVASIARARDAFSSPQTKLRARLARHHADVDGAFQGWCGAWLDPEFRRWDLRGALAGISAPVLVVQGEDDEYGTLAQVDAVCTGVSGPARRLVLPRCGHSPHKDAPAAVIAAIQSFVSVP